jgi:multidrug efflux system outer membrane protein
MRKFSFALIGLATLSGCNLAPPYRQPAPPVYDAYPVATSGGTRVATEIGWQSFFGDAQLKAYIAAALANNRDLAASVARIAQARAQYRIQNSERLPQVGVGASGTRTRTPIGSLGLGDTLNQDDAEVPDAFTASQYNVQVAVTSFELDFWGRVRNLSAAARGRYLATVEAERAFRLSLISDVAASYYAIRAGEEGISLAERTVLARREALEIARLRLDAGVTSSVDYDQAAVLVTQAKTELADLRRSTEQQRNALLVLIGGPMAGELPRGRRIEDPGQFEPLDAGLPSLLLISRPDVLQAEQELRAANADIGAARAAFFPTISLTGNYGFASPDLGDLLKRSAQSWTFGALLNLPIFDGGRREAQLGQARARQEELVATYQRTVQNAFREVSDALVGRQRYREQIRAQEEAVAAYRRLAQTARDRYDNGISIYLEVLDAERNLFSAEQQLIQLRATALQNGVSLYTALGGGLRAQ